MLITANQPQKNMAINNPLPYNLFFLLLNKQEYSTLSKTPAGNKILKLHFFLFNMGHTVLYSCTENMKMEYICNVSAVLYFKKKTSFS